MSRKHDPTCAIHSSDDDYTRCTCGPLEDCIPVAGPADVVSDDVKLMTAAELGIALADAPLFVERYRKYWGDEADDLAILFAGLHATALAGLADRDRLAVLEEVVGNGELHNGDYLEVPSPYALSYWDGDVRRIAPFSTLKLAADFVIERTRSGHRPSSAGEPTGNELDEINGRLPTEPEKA